MNEVSDCIVFTRSQEQKSRHIIDNIQKTTLKSILSERMLEVHHSFKSFEIVNSCDDMQKLS